MPGNGDYKEFLAQTIVFGCFGERALFFDEYRKAVDDEAARGVDPEVAAELKLWDRTVRDGLADA